MTLTVVRYGTDSSGRPIYATPYAVEWLDAFADACRSFREPFTPTIVQGAFMSRVAGGGADESAGYHDGAGTYDWRTWDLSDAQAAFQAREARRRGCAYWPRDHEHGGMDEHGHGVIIGDTPAAQSPGARWQVLEYHAERDGLASRGRDYVWRPDPLVLDWQPVPDPRPTPNITAALRAPDVEARKAALRRIIAGGSPAAQTQARRWLAALLKIEAGRQKAAAARVALRGLEVRK